MVWEDAHEAGFPRNTPAPGSFTDWTRLNRLVRRDRGTRGVTANLTGSGVPEQVIGRAVTPQFFTVLGVNPIAGRTFTAAEDRSNVQVAVISYGLWQRRFGGQPAAIGSPILMNGNRFEVIGVMPRRFRVPQPRRRLLDPDGLLAGSRGSTHVTLSERCRQTGARRRSRGRQGRHAPRRRRAAARKIRSRAGT
jgi:hypothetical protein